ncbi:CDGSH iron-sulfur domain-containing protein [Streptomyces sp. NPDC091204]|uniref:CDGSH iron-sulfur domain-containing protein n=1 Tax=Streptomyces sp. NPDC091204 TaxID=3155299 RepID=UPI00342E6CD6
MPRTSDSGPCPADGVKPARRLSLDPRGPVLIEGPVDIVLDDGKIARSDRFTVAICTCHRSRTYPWCGTSHRPHERTSPQPEDRNP